MINWPLLLQIAGALLVFSAALAVLAKGARWVFATLRMIREFLEDWRGEDARPGYAKRPGVMERLVSLEDGLATVKHEVQPNSGTSLKDQITRIESHAVPVDSRPVSVP